MNEMVHTSIKVICKMFCTSSPRRSCHWADIVSCPLIANVIKNNTTSLVIYIIVCLSKTR